MNPANEPSAPQQTYPCCPLSQSINLPRSLLVKLPFGPAAEVGRSADDGAFATPDADVFRHPAGAGPGRDVDVAEDPQRFAGARDEAEEAGETEAGGVGRGRRYRALEGEDRAFRAGRRDELVAPAVGQVGRAGLLAQLPVGAVGRVEGERLVGRGGRPGRVFGDDTEVVRDTLEPFDAGDHFLGIRAGRDFTVGHRRHAAVFRAGAVLEPVVRVLAQRVDDSDQVGGRRLHVGREEAFDLGRGRERRERFRRPVTSPGPIRWSSCSGLRIRGWGPARRGRSRCSCWRLRPGCRARGPYSVHSESVVSLNSSRAVPGTGLGIADEVFGLIVASTLRRFLPDFGDRVDFRDRFHRRVVDDVDAVARADAGPGRVRAGGYVEVAGDRVEPEAERGAEVDPVGVLRVVVGRRGRQAGVVDRPDLLHPGGAVLIPLGSRRM